MVDRPRSGQAEFSQYIGWSRQAADEQTRSANEPDQEQNQHLCPKLESENLIAQARSGGR